MAKEKVKKNRAGSDLKINSVSGILLVVLLSLLLYGQSIGFQFTLDDDLFIRNNPDVQKGLSSIPATFTKGSMEHFRGSNFQIYRPALISFFCLERTLFGFNASAFHFVNLILYIGISIVLFKLLQIILRQLHPGYLYTVLALFVVHPVHSEVVASVKSQDELLAGLFSLLSLLFYLRSIKSSPDDFRLTAISTFFFLLALFSKESAFAFTAIFPLSLLVYERADFKKGMIRFIPLLGAAVFFIGVRYMVLKDYFQAYETSAIENVLYATTNFNERTATIFAILWHYIRLMIWPHPLTWDYSFQQIPVYNWSSYLPWISAASFALIGFTAFRYLKRLPVVSYGILFYLILIVPTSNIFFLNGTTFAERFLFLPSVGFLTSAAVLFSAVSGMNISHHPKSESGYFMPVTMGILILFTVLTIKRTGDWKNNFEVFRSGAENAPMSSRTTAGLATEYMNMAEKERNTMTRNQYIDSSIFYFKRSLENFPGNSNSSYKLGLIYSITGNNSLSVQYYKRSIAAKPDFVLALNNIGALYASMNRPDSALFYFTKSLAVDSVNEMTLTNLTVVSNMLNDMNATIHYGELAIGRGFGNEKIYKLLSTAYERSGNPEKSAYYLNLPQVTPAPR